MTAPEPTEPELSTPELAEPDPTATPGSVIAAATVVVPFLIVYAFLFIAHGFFVQVEQPDVTGSRGGEGVAGLVAFAFLLVVLWGMLRLLNGRDRWALVAGQLVTFAVSLDFVLDASSGDPQVPVVVMLASALSIGLAMLAPSRSWVRTAGGTQPAEREPERAQQPAEH